MGETKDTLLVPVSWTSLMKMKSYYFSEAHKLKGPFRLVPLKGFKRKGPQDVFTIFTAFAFSSGNKPPRHRLL